MSQNILRCRYCGGDIEIESNNEMGKCIFCGSKVIISKNSEHKLALFNRANYLRQNNQFDRAINIYEDILKEDNTDAVAHWELALCKYGIEYVKDPKTDEMIPSLHRTHYKMIMADDDYKAAIKYSDDEAGRMYFKEAQKIEAIQKKYISIANSEENYDIFICYKESEDGSGERTEDSVSAQDIYSQLVKKGYRVFFARKTLESKMGQEYEPIIFAALNSAKIMLVVGSKIEHYNAVWVKNEWSRFMELMSEDSSKLLIPIYKNISPYDMPDELQPLQSMNMGKLGFIQDLLDGIDKILRKNVEAPGKNSSSADDFNNLIHRGDVFLKIDNFEEARKIYDYMVQLYPEHYEGWWGKIICETHKFTFMDLATEEIESINNVFMHYIKQLATEEKYNELYKEFSDYYNKLFYKNMSELADEAVKRTINSLNREIHDLKSIVVQEQRKIMEADAKINYSKTNFDEKQKQLAIEKEELEWSHKKKLGKTVSSGVSSFFVILLSIVALAFACAFIFWGVVCMEEGNGNVYYLLFAIGGIFALIIIAKLIKHFRELIRNSRLKKYDYESRLTEIANLSKKVETNMNNSISMYIRQKENAAANVNRYNSILDNKMNFVNLGNENLKQFFYVRICNEHGMSYNINPEIENMFNLANEKI